MFQTLVRWKTEIQERSQQPTTSSYDLYNFYQKWEIRFHGVPVWVGRDTLVSKIKIPASWYLLGWSLGRLQHTSWTRKPRCVHLFCLFLFLIEHCISRLLLGNHVMQWSKILFSLSRYYQLNCSTYCRSLWAGAQGLRLSISLLIFFMCAYRCW